MRRCISIMNKLKNRVITILFLSSFIIAQPIIDLIEPAFGGIGSTVTISGNNFSSTSIENTVFLSGLEANILNSTENEIIVSVPYGATMHPFQYIQMDFMHLPVNASMSSLMLKKN